MPTLMALRLAFLPLIVTLVRDPDTLAKTSLPLKLIEIRRPPRLVAVTLPVCSAILIVIFLVSPLNLIRSLTLSRVGLGTAAKVAIIC